MRRKGNDGLALMLYFICLFVFILLYLFSAPFFETLCLKESAIGNDPTPPLVL
jgi:hypothetical protein